jgi:hypothetical protein
MSSATKAEGMCASRRKVYYSTAHERTTIIYPDDNRFAVTDVRYANLCSERERVRCAAVKAPDLTRSPFAVFGPLLAV